MFLQWMVGEWYWLFRHSWHGFLLFQQKVSVHHLKLDKEKQRRLQSESIFPNLSQEQYLSFTLPHRHQVLKATQLLMGLIVWLLNTEKVKALKTLAWHLSREPMKEISSLKKKKKNSNII